MTSIDYTKISRGWDLIAEGAAEIAQAYAALEQPGAGAPPPAPAPADDLPPLEEAPRAAEKPQNAALGVCPVHRTAWTVKAGGISKNGKPYPPFWKCSGKTDGQYCNEKPVKGWADSHPIPVEAVA